MENQAAVKIGKIETRPEHDPYTGGNTRTVLAIMPETRGALVYQGNRTGSTTMLVWNRLEVEQEIAGHPDEGELRAWLETGEGQELLQRVCDGFEISYRTNNPRGVYSEDAEAALVMLDAELYEGGESMLGNKYLYWDIDDLVTAADWGVTAETSDEELAWIAKDIDEAIAVENWVASEDILAYLCAEREAMREMSGWDIER